MNYSVMYEEKGEKGFLENTEIDSDCSYTSTDSWEISDRDTSQATDTSVSHLLYGDDGFSGSLSSGVYSSLTNNPLISYNDSLHLSDRESCKQELIPKVEYFGGKTGKAENAFYLSKEELLFDYNEDNESISSDGSDVTIPYFSKNSSSAGCLADSPRSSVMSSAVLSGDDGSDIEEGYVRRSRNRNQRLPEVTPPAITELSRLPPTQMGVREGKYIKCRCCTILFKTREKLVRHFRQRHVQTGSYQCEICKSYFKKPEYLREHMSIHSGERRLLCEICDLRFRCRRTLRGHMKTQKHFEELAKKLGISVSKLQTLQEGGGIPRFVHSLSLVKRALSKARYTGTRTGVLKDSLYTKKFLQERTEDDGLDLLALPRKTPRRRSLAKDRNACRVPSCGFGQSKDDFSAVDGRTKQDFIIQAPEATSPLRLPGVRSHHEVERCKNRTSTCSRTRLQENVSNTSEPKVTQQSVSCVGDTEGQGVWMNCDGNMFSSLARLGIKVEDTPCTSASFFDMKFEPSPLRHNSKSTSETAPPTQVILPRSKSTVRKPLDVGSSTSTQSLYSLPSMSSGSRKRRSSKIGSSNSSFVCFSFPDSNSEETREKRMFAPPKVKPSKYRYATNTATVPFSLEQSVTVKGASGIDQNVILVLPPDMAHQVS